MINVILAEDHTIVRNGIKLLLQDDPEINVVGEAVNGREALGYIKKGIHADVILADINMPELDGMALLKAISNIGRGPKVIILSMFDNDKYVTRAFESGASGYLVKSISPAELIFAIKHVFQGGRYLCSDLAVNMVEKLAHLGNGQEMFPENEIEFSSRELEVINLIAEGLTNSEVADRLFISKRTVEGHRQALIGKTHAKNTAALIKYGVRAGIIR